MTEYVRKRIFQPFFTTKVPGGTVLGLWVSAEILKTHEAAIRVRSRTSRKSTEQCFPFSLSRNTRK